ncbi:hypothetical protein [Nocardioides sp. LHG3406-4]|uniref:hypothetical protein n=1 Tax=Nocardioides sp. LHG3406-4 TaxID=2804575 RepID=UPI003CE78791
MSNAHVAGHVAHTRAPRVRDQARAVVALMTFSALASGCLAAGLLLLTTLGR